jgi:hypothetical protein
MKKSELKVSIKEKIIKILKEAEKEDLESQKDLNKELEKTVEFAKELAEADDDDIKAQQDLSKELDITKKKVDDLTKAGEKSSLAEKDSEDEDENEDKEPTKAQLKSTSKDSVATIAIKLQQITKEMKSTVNKWKTSEGEEKQKLRDKLLKLTNIKKELESML